MRESSDAFRYVLAAGNFHFTATFIATFLQGIIACFLKLISAII
jgi:hypothetical protein